MSTIMMAQRKETTILEVSGSLATPLTVQTSKGTYTVYNRTELNGSISVRSAVDANGNKVVVPNGDYKSHTSNGKSEYTRIYRFKTLYNSSSSSSSSSSGSSYGSNRAYSNNITNTSAASTSDSELDITGYWVYVNVSDSRFTESKKIMLIAEDKYESENMSLFNNELQGTVSKDVIVKNKNGDWESTTVIRRDYDNAIRTTTCLYEIKGNRMIVHCKYQTDFYSDSDFRNYRSTGEISEQDFIYTRK